MAARDEHGPDSEGAGVEASTSIQPVRLGIPHGCALEPPLSETLSRSDASNAVELLAELLARTVEARAADVVGEGPPWQPFSNIRSRRS